jgi:hypothetical protein
VSKDEVGVAVESPAEHERKLVEWTDGLKAKYDDKPRYSDGRAMEYDAIGEERIGRAERNAENVKPRLSGEAAAVAIEALSARLEVMTRRRDKAQDEVEKLRWQWEKDLKELLVLQGEKRRWEEDRLQLSAICKAAGLPDGPAVIDQMAQVYIAAVKKKMAKSERDRKRKR